MDVPVPKVVVNRLTTTLFCIWTYKMAKKYKRFYPDWFIDELANDTDKTLARQGLLSTTKKVEFRCACGNTYIQKITNHINLKEGIHKTSSCKECSLKKMAENTRTRLKTNNPFPDWFINELVNEDEILKAKSGELKAADTPTFKCLLCGNVYTQRVASHITLSTGEKKKGCPKCGINKQKSSAKKKRGILDFYPDWFIDELVNDVDKEKARAYTLQGIDRVQLYCKQHDTYYMQQVRVHIDQKTHERKRGCPLCSVRKKKDIISENRTYPDWFIDDIYLASDKERAINGTLGTREKIQFYCSTHNKSYEQMVGCHIRIKTGKPVQGCPYCGRDAYYARLSEERHYPDWFINSLVNEEDKEKAKNGTLVTTDVVEFKCPRGHVYLAGVNNQIIISSQERNRGCPICFNNRSKPEMEIEEYVQSLGIKTEHKHFVSTEIGKFEVDIYIPDKSIGIEYNGSYYHNTLSSVVDKYVRGKDKLYHQRKYTACNRLGVKLISIFDVDWNERQDKVRQYLKDTLQPTQQKIYARKCDIKQIDYQLVNIMYEKYHLLGKTTIQSISYGLFYDNELVSCMSFQKGRYKENKEPVWCLTRFVTKSGFVVIGGASKLLSKFEKEYSPSILISYSDNDYFQGGVYSKLGFDCLGLTKSPRYYWYYKNKELKREQCQLKRLAKKYPELYQESLSLSGNKEDYIMLKLGAMKVYRSGHTKWIKRYYKNIDNLSS